MKISSVGRCLGVCAVLAAPLALFAGASGPQVKTASGTVEGKDALRSYFKRGLEAYPGLAFELLDVMWGISTVVLYYVNQNGTKSAEFMEFDTNGKVIRVIANYDRS